MFQRIAKAMVLLAAVQLFGGHWIALQSAAWIGMVVTYSQEDSLVSAFEKTFDGEHPCEMCKAVKNGQNEEKKQEVSKAFLKIEAVLASTIPAQTHFGSKISYKVVEQHSASRSLAPPTPPPLG